MSKETKFVSVLIVGILVFIFVSTFLLIGPAGFSNRFSSWKASAYGSDWFVVQYAQDGSVINYWNLEDCAVENEAHSDGIYFTSDGSVKHLSGHYIYIQNPTENDKNKLLRK